MRALIAMSGGVDSSVAALLARKAGYECTGCTMRLYKGEGGRKENGEYCGSLKDAGYAAEVAARLGMDYRVFDFTGEFEERVIKKFVRRYESGLTPNPCAYCNRYMKFAGLLKKADELGCEKLVTGHYAVVERENGGYSLKKGADPTKDQSYVLYSLTQEQLARVMFPLGKLSKTETRRIARENGFANAQKPDSQDICFARGRDYIQLLADYGGRPPVPGDFVDKSGKVLGRHRGITYYTIGQRRGIGIAAERPLYVCRIDRRTNRVVLGFEEDLYSKEAFVINFNWISGRPPEGGIKCSVRVRYHGPENPATAFPEGEDCARIVFDTPRRSVAPGQIAVLYDGDRVLGGGEIASRGNPACP